MHQLRSFLLCRVFYLRRISNGIGDGSCCYTGTNNQFISSNIVTSQTIISASKDW